LSARAAGAGVVIASRPKNGASHSLIRLLVNEHENRLAGPEQCENAPRAVRAFRDQFHSSIDPALTHHPAVDKGIVHRAIDAAAFEPVLRGSERQHLPIGEMPQK